MQRSRPSLARAHQCVCAWSRSASGRERCMAISVAVPVGKETADRLVKAHPDGESLRIGPYTDGKADMGPVVTKEAKERILGPDQQGCRARRRSCRRWPRFQAAGLREWPFRRRLPVRRCHMDIYNEIFGPVLSVVRAKLPKKPWNCRSKHEYGNGVAIYTRDGDATAIHRAPVNMACMLDVRCSAGLSLLRRLEVLLV